jgi:hypothetical protein
LSKKPLTPLEKSSDSEWKRALRRLFLVRPAFSRVFLSGGSMNSA